MFEVEAKININKNFKLQCTPSAEICVFTHKISCRNLPKFAVAGLSNICQLSSTLGCRVCFRRDLVGGEAKFSVCRCARKKPMRNLWPFVAYLIIYFVFHNHTVSLYTRTQLLKLWLHQLWIIWLLTCILDYYNGCATVYETRVAWLQAQCSNPSASLPSQIIVMAYHFLRTYQSMIWYWQ